jgi:ABC-2 type transport system ATP-binding protein
MTDPAAPVVSFQDLSVAYGDALALSSVSGAFPAEATGLLGPNGAGKTTLLKTLMGFLAPRSGGITAFGLDPVVDPLGVRQRVGYLPEGDCYLPGLTAAEQVAFAGELSGLPHGDAISRAHEVLDYVALGEARYRRVDTFSTGMKQRVKLAMALVHDPELLLLDEPTNGLDPKGRDEMLILIRDVASRPGMGLVLSSHLLHDVENICSHLIVLNQGRVVLAGALNELTGPPRRAYDVRVKGDSAALLTDLKDEGCAWTQGDDGYRVLLAETQGPELLFRLARDCGAQLRYVRPAQETLEDVFLRALCAASEGSESWSGGVPPHQSNARIHFGRRVRISRGPRPCRSTTPCTAAIKPVRRCARGASGPSCARLCARCCCAAC